MEIKLVVVFKFNEFGNVAADDVTDGLTALAVGRKQDVINEV